MKRPIRFKRPSLRLALLLALAATGASAAPRATIGSFGIALDHRDLTAQPGDDFDRYANGLWFDQYQLKDHETRYGAFTMLGDQAEIDVRALIEGISAEEATAGSEAQKIRDLYASFMDLDARNAAGIAPIQPLLDRIEGIRNQRDLIDAFGRSGYEGTISPFTHAIGADRKQPDVHLLSIGVGGIGLPDRDFYLNPDARFVTIRTAYQAYISRLLGFAGVESGESRAAAVLDLETRIATAHWPRAEQRDRDKTYNRVSFRQLKRDYRGYDWRRHLRAAGIAPPAELNLNTPSSMAPVIGLIDSIDLAVWRDYLRFHALNNHAKYLSEEIDRAHFEFNGKTLLGQQAPREWWKRAVDEVGGLQGLGDAIGKRYVARHFKPEARVAMTALVENLRAALRSNIEQLDWMGEATKAEAFRKLERFRPKIGYPDRWRDYGSITIVRADLLANINALRRYQIADQNRRLGQPTDRDEWRITPQTVNAYYNPTFNEIVFPAAILQPPFFDLHADAAVNYGGIGAVIGHEMGHGFDDQGSKSDFAGIQRNWWSDEDRARFEQRTRSLGAQYSQYCPFEGQCVNGALSMGENIGDLGGLSMAYTAYQRSLNGQTAPVLDGLSGDQRFFLAWAQVWKAKYRDEATINQLRVGPHSPPRYRILGPLRNLDVWYRAFDVQPDDQMYLPPEQRVRIW